MPVTAITNWMTVLSGLGVALSGTECVVVCPFES